MMAVLTFVHAVVCILLIVIVLIQSGRGGGLTEGFAAAESVFGAKTNEMMVKATGIAGVVFLVTSLSLAHLSSRAERSLMAGQDFSDIPVTQEVTIPAVPKDVLAPETEPIKDMEQPIQAQTQREVVR